MGNRQRTIVPPLGDDCTFSDPPITLARSFMDSHAEPGAIRRSEVESAAIVLYGERASLFNKRQLDNDDSRSPMQADRVGHRLLRETVKVFRECLSMKEHGSGTLDAAFDLKQLADFGRPEFQSGHESTTFRRHGQQTTSDKFPCHPDRLVDERHDLCRFSAFG